MPRFLLAAIALALFLPASAGAAAPPAIEGAWAVKAEIVRATGGAKPRGGAVRRSTWTALPCAAPCGARLALKLPGGGHTRISYERGRITYAGDARSRMLCRGGARVRATVEDRFQISRQVRRGDRRLAANLSGTTVQTGTCRGRTAVLVLNWTTKRTDLPEPPTPSLTAAPDPVSLAANGGVATFTDVSDDAVDGGTIVSRVWDFGDPGSGAANAASGAEVSHRYTAAGTFTVSLTVTDDDGLSSTVTDVFIVDP